MLKKLNKMREERGFISIFILLIVCITLPFLFFHMIEETYLYGQKDRIQHMNDLAASAGIMQLNDEILKDGKISLIETDVQKVVRKMIIENFNLDENMIPRSNSSIYTKPYLKVLVVNPTTPTTVNIHDVVYTISNPTVLVYTEVKPKGIFFNKAITLKSVSAYAVSFKTEIGNNDTFMGTELNEKGLILTMNRVVNPLHSDFPPLKWEFPRLPMTAGGNIEFSLMSKDPTVKLKAEYELKVIGSNYNERILGTMIRDSHQEFIETIQIPPKAPVGSKIMLNVKNPPTFESGDLEIGEVEANLFKLIRFTKIYPDNNS